MSIERGKYTTLEGLKTWEYLTVFACSIMSLCGGSVIGWNSPTIDKLMELDSPILITASEASTLVTATFIGFILTSPFCVFTVDKIGRKNVILCSALPLIVSWCLITVAINFWMLYVGRIMAGLFLGIFTFVMPLYTGEIASTNLRGTGVTLNNIMFNLGILGTFVIAPYLSVAVMASIFLSIAVGFVVIFCFMPESPYYLAMRGRTKEAKEVLKKLRGKMDVSEEMEVIVETVNLDNQKNRNIGIKNSLKKLLLVRGNLRAFAIVNLAAMTLHLGGYFIIVSYVQLIFKSTATSIVSDYTVTISIGAVQLIFAIISLLVVDKLGRKPLMLFSGLVAAASNFAIGIFFYAKDYLDADVSAYSLVPFISVILLMFAFNFGLNSLQLILRSELFAVEVKALGSCLVSIVTSFISVVVLKGYILVAVTWGYGHSPPFLTFFAFMVICTIIIFYLSPETKNKTFVQIQRELNN